MAPWKPWLTTIDVTMKPNQTNAPDINPLATVTYPVPRWPTTPASTQAMISWETMAVI